MKFYVNDYKGAVDDFYISNKVKVWNKKGESTTRS